MWTGIEKINNTYENPKAKERIIRSVAELSFMRATRGDNAVGLGGAL